MQFLNSIFKSKKNSTNNPISETKSYASSFLLASHIGQAQWSGCDYHNLSKKGYCMNPIVYACIRMIAEGAARTPFDLYHADELINEHRLLDVIKRPSLNIDGRIFRTSVFSQLLLTGNCYIDCGLLSEKGRDALYVLRSDRITALTDKEGYITGYEYAIGSVKQRYHLDRILHIKLFSPDSDYYGLSPTVAAWRSIELHNETTIFQKALLDNSARPSGCLVYSGLPGAPNLTEAQFIRLKTELQDAYTGSVAAGRPMILEGGLEWKSMSLSPVDIGIDRMRHDAARDIALAYGIPPMLLGIPGDNTYSNYQEAIRVFTRNTLIPMAELFLESFAYKMSLFFGDDFELRVNRNKIAEQFTDHKEG
jgi:HK97 family phage portal protein